MSCRRTPLTGLLAAAALMLWPAALPARAAQQRPGGVFQDCRGCPEMVVIPSGSYVMGSTPEERAKLGVPAIFDAMESPRHDVTIGYSFAVGRFSVTFEQWDACVADGGCKGYKPDDNGWGRGRRPVSNVDWKDAQAYVAWISRKTGKRYRLLSEAEWEYAARAGSTGYYFFGSTIDDSKANFGKHRGMTTPVGSFPPNAFGLYDMSGNTAQWVQDCYHPSYEGAPTDGSAWLTGECITRNVRGGGWSLDGWSVRSAQRVGDPPGSRNDHLGFRVARDF